MSKIEGKQAQMEAEIAKSSTKKIKDFSFNYVDRVRLSDPDCTHAHAHQHLDYNCKCVAALRHAGWRHNRSVSHLDLATSCHHTTAYGLSRWPSKAAAHHQHQQQQQQQQQQPHHHHHHHQLRHTRSLDYNFNNHNHNAANERYDDVLDIAEYYWRIDPDEELEELYCDNQQQQHLDYATDDINYHPKTNSHQQQALLAAYDFASESCSLRRSRSLAVIREETFSDLQITATNKSSSNIATTDQQQTNLNDNNDNPTTAQINTNNNSNNNNNSNSPTTAAAAASASTTTTNAAAQRSSRRSQLIPRARLVNRGFFRERERLICGNNKHHHHHHLNATLEQVAANNSNNNNCKQQQQQDIDNHSNPSTCDSHQRQKQLLLQQHQSCDSHQQSHESKSNSIATAAAANDSAADDYYENLKRLDALALGLTEHLHLHPWHNDKSDLESLNSDYFKNSLHQANDQQQQQHICSQQQYELEALEKSVQLLSSEKTRIYQSRRSQQQQQRHANTTQAKLAAALSASQAAATDSCPENSQSSVFPETTTSNSDDQTEDDSPSLSEQEYDVSRIEEIFKQSLPQTDSEETTPDDDNEDTKQTQNNDDSYEIISLTATHTAHYTEETKLIETLEPQRPNKASTNQLRRAQSFRSNLDKLISYDSVYLSSEESTDDTLVADNEPRQIDLAAASTLLHISIEDTVYEQPDQTVAVNIVEQLEIFEQQQPPQLYTQILKVEHKPSQLLSVVEKRKLKREEGEHLKRPATDTLYLAAIKSQHYTPHTEDNNTNSKCNQYHSLPDINIGQSLKVSECIDAELRSSYNLIRYKQKQQAEKAKKESSRQQFKRNEDIVTKAEIYNSIKRFGRAHQKARQRECQEFNAQHATQEQEQKDKQILKEKAEQRQQSEERAEKATEEQKQEEQKKDSNKLAIYVPHVPTFDAYEQPKEAPNIEVTDFSKQIERRAKEIRQAAYRQQKPTTPAIRIIVTDTQDNIIEEDSIEGQPEVLVQSDNNDTKTVTAVAAPHKSPIARSKVQKAKLNNCGITRTASLKRRLQTKPKPKQLTHSAEQNVTVSNTANDEDAIKSKERRVLSTEIYKARPARIESFRRNNIASGIRKMSRPQILHVVDNKRQQQQQQTPNVATTSASEAANEYLRKVDAVRCYWTKLAQEEEQQRANNMEEQQQQQCVIATNEAPSKTEEHNQSKAAVRETERQFVLGPQQHNQNKPQATTTLTKPLNEDFCSFMPSIEIVELGPGEQKATIVAAPAAVYGNDQNNNNNSNDNNNDDNEPQFDHIRYKVLKSEQLLRKHSTILSRNPKEAQFDGLIQYLQEYSFQELLSNNNVVIVEPVRTKIERPMEIGGRSYGSSAPKYNQGGQTANKDKTAPKHEKSGFSGCSGGIKRHFFYQPVRVNRELYEEELPDPDTVRSVREFFEQQNIRLPHQQEHKTSAPYKEQCGGDTVDRSEEINDEQLSPRSRRARKYRFLTIDTSYGYQTAGMPTAGVKANASTPKLGTPASAITPSARKWDTSSLSSGISSGDLSSPCDYNEHEQQQTPSNSVQQAVQQHQRQIDNNSANNSNRPLRPWQGIQRTGSSSCSSGQYRKIYENNANKLLPLRETLRPSRSVVNVAELGRRRRFCYDETAADAEEHVQRDYDAQRAEAEAGADDEDADDELGASYYVSNDVLEKIRQCGSSVTYYGGRVLKRSSTPDNSNEHQQPQPFVPVSMSQMTMARQRAREIERKNSDVHAEQGRSKSGKLRGPLDRLHKENGSYSGVAFKLVKSNSCSSRLELAGAAATANDIQTPSNEPVVVKQMVDHFEHNKHANNVSSTDNLLTINNQMPINKIESAELSAPSAVKLVTVNNHINMPQQQQQPSNDTYQSVALNIHLKGHGQQNNYSISKSSIPTAEQHPANEASLLAAGDGCSTTSTGKICRNKNVDLAFTMRKQPQYGNKNKDESESVQVDNEGKHLLNGGSSGGGVFGSTTEPRPSNSKQSKLYAQQPAARQRQQQQPLPQHEQQQQLTTNNDSNEETPSVNVSGIINAFSESLAKPHSRLVAHVKANNCIARENEEQKLTKPQQIVVPVEIHTPQPARQQQTPNMEQHQQERRLSASAMSTTSSILSSNSSTNSAASSSSTNATTTSKAKKVVQRHYVANDKSLFERRKYDDIEFEEFEVYDPTKDIEKLLDKQEQQKLEREQLLADDDGAVDIRLDNNNNSADNGEQRDMGITSETDCYDSLDDKC